MDATGKEVADEVLSIRGMLAVALTLLVLYVLKAVQVFVVPLLFSAMIIMLVAPLLARLDRVFKGKARALSILLTMVVIIAALALFFEGLWFTLSSIARHLPAYSERFAAFTAEFSRWAQAHHLPLSPGGSQAGAVARSALGLLGPALSSLSSFLGSMGLIFIYVLLMLIELHEWREKAVSAFGGQAGGQAVETVRTISRRVREYLYNRTLINLMVGAATGIWLGALKVDFAFVFAILAFLFNYIPYIGSFVVAFLAALVALLQYGVSFSIVTLAGLFLIYQVSAAFVEPRLQAKTASVSPFLVFLSIVFWSWMWGIAGTIVAVPIAIALVVAGESVPGMRPLLLLLKSAEKKPGTK